MEVLERMVKWVVIPVVLQKVEIDPYPIAKILFLHAREYVENAGFLSCIRIDDQTLRVIDAIPGQGDIQSSVYVQLEKHSMLKAYKKLEDSGRIEEFLGGWYHTHPNIGAHFLSKTDVNTHEAISALFSDAFALVLDPLDIFSRKSFDQRNLAAYILSDSEIKKIEVHITSPPLVWDILSVLEYASSKTESVRPQNVTIEQTPPVSEKLVSISRSLLLQIFIEWSIILLFSISAVLITVL